MLVYQLVVILNTCLFVLFVELFSNSLSGFIVSVDLMTQALFYSQGIRAFPFATFTTYHHLDPPIVLLYGQQISIIDYHFYSDVQQTYLVQCLFCQE